MPKGNGAADWKNAPNKKINPAPVVLSAPHNPKQLCGFIGRPAERDWAIERGYYNSLRLPRGPLKFRFTGEGARFGVVQRFGDV